MTSLRAAYAAQSSPTAAQLQAWERFNQLGLPGFRDEQWKYTQLHRLYSQSFTDLKSSSSITTIEGLSIKRINTPNHIVNDPFVALNHALNAEELLIEVADNTEINQPLELRFAASGEAPTINAPRVTLKLGRNSKLTLVEHSRSVDATAHLNLSVITISLAENAHLQHCCLQDENRGSFHICNVDVDVSEQARYINHQFNLGGSLSRTDINIKLNGAQSYAELNGLQFAVGNQVLDTHSRVEHCVPHARSSETYHGIADDRGQVVFNGKVMVHKHAIGTDAQQSSRNLLLSPKAEIDTKPELEIYADDVKCSHGATVGQLDNTALFYLRSRGIGEQEARALLTLAFADAIINKLPLAPLRETLTQQVHARFNTNKELAL